jgi:hypothetical protein
VPNRFPRAGSDDRPVGLVLGTGRSLGAVRMVLHDTPTQYFEIQGAIDASNCRRASVHDLLHPGAGSNVVPYDDIELGLSPRPYYIRPGLQSSTLVEVDLSAQRPTT